MIEKLQKEGAEAARKKAYCDEEMAKTKAKKEEVEDKLKSLDTKLDKTSSKHKRLTGDVNELEAEELKLSKSVDEMRNLYTEDKAEYEKAKAEAEAGLAGIQKAIKVLRDYYSSKDDVDKTSSANVIVGMLEESESKMSKWLMDVRADARALESNYDQFTQQSKADMKAKETEEKYKKRGGKKLGKMLSVFRQDRDSEKEQLDAVSSYDAKLQKECVAKPDSFEERAKRRAKEIEGLKTALDVLGSETALLQEGASHRTLRGGSAAALGLVASS